MKGSDECPRCGSRSAVIDTRRFPNGFLRRRRKCIVAECGARWTTAEIPQIKLKDFKRLSMIRRVLAIEVKGEG